MQRFVEQSQRSDGSLQIEPVEGGSANDYDYVAGDPVNDKDLDGLMGEGQCKRNPNLPICNGTHNARGIRVAGRHGSW